MLFTENSIKEKSDDKLRLIFCHDFCLRSSEEEYQEIENRQQRYPFYE
jgi:hypothetical protein